MDDEIIIIISSDPGRSPASNENVFPATVSGCNDAIAVIEKFRAQIPNES